MDQKHRTLCAATLACAGAVFPGAFTQSSSAMAATPNVVATAIPRFTPSPGTYATSRTVTLSDETAGAVIYYTTDGSLPTTNSTEYTAPIDVNLTTTINAIAIASGYKQSHARSGTYKISYSVLHSFAGNGTGDGGGPPRERDSGQRWQFLRDDQQWRDEHRLYGGLRHRFQDHSRWG